MILTTYQLTCEPSRVEAFAEEIALEQTVEVPRKLVTDPTIAHEVIGQVRSITPLPTTSSSSRASAFEVKIAYQTWLASEQLPQLLNLLFGNISIKQNILLTDVELPADFLAKFPGPRLGIDTLRQWLGVYDRPLLATAIKPRGSSLDTLARIAGDFALGGGDVVKDDHNLCDSDVATFLRRVEACHVAVEQANARTGRRCLYFPSISGRFDELQRMAEALVKLGVQGVLIAPMLVGIDAVRALAQQYPLFMMAHPTFAGTFFSDRTHGITPGLLLGSLFRLAGCDASIYPNAGGRFGFTQAQCSDITHRLTAPWAHLAPSWPAPAGGMQLSNLADMAKNYGQQCIFLVGGALLTHRPSLVDSTREFAAELAGHFTPRHVEPQRAFASTCEVDHGQPPMAAPRSSMVEQGEPPPLRHLQASPIAPDQPLRWREQASSAYKTTNELPFQGIVRHELLGKSGEVMRFDLRYFEIAPGGFSSLEKHQHTHTVIGVRGQGTLLVNGQSIALRPHDIAYVPPMQVHQLCNQGGEPFGFYCIVDRERDRPQAP